MRNSALLTCSLLLALVIISGCAVNREYEVGLSYYPYSSLKNNAPRNSLTVALAPLSDSRTEKKLLFKEYNNWRGEDRYYWRDERVNLKVTEALKEGLQEAGIKVVEIPSWDGKGASLSQMSDQTVLTGIIDEFSCTREVASTPMLPVLVGKARLTVYLGDKLNGTVIEQRFESSFQNEEFLFITEEDVEHTLSVVMSDLIEKIVKSPLISQMRAGI